MHNFLSSYTSLSLTLLLLGLHLNHRFPPHLGMNVYKTQQLVFPYGHAESAQDLGFNDAHRFCAEMDKFHQK